MKYFKAAEAYSSKTMKPLSAEAPSSETMKHFKAAVALYNKIDPLLLPCMTDLLS